MILIITCIILSINVVGANDVNDTDNLTYSDSSDVLADSNVFNVTDDNQAVYFNSGTGIPNSLVDVKSGDTLILSGTFKDRTFRLKAPLNIVGTSDCLLKDCNFILEKGASGSNLTGLHIVNSNIYGIYFDASNCTVKDCSVYSTGPSAYNIILNTNACYNNITENYFKAGSYTDGSTTKSVSNIVMGDAHYNYIANNYLEFDDANSIYLSKWGSDYFRGGISDYNVIFNNTLRCNVVPTSWCYAIQIYGTGNKIDSNRIIGAYRGISGDENTIIVNNYLINLTGKDYDTHTLTGAEFGIVSGANSIIKNNTITDSIISTAAIYGGAYSTITNNYVNVGGNAYGIEAIGDDINVSFNRVIVTSGSGIYQNGKYSGLFVGYNNVTATFGVGILVKKASSTKIPSNVTVVSNNVNTYNKYSINIKDVNKNSYIIIDNVCNSMILTPDSESGTLNNTCLIINISGTFDDLAEALNIIEDGGVINLTGNIHLMGMGSTDTLGIPVVKSVTIEGNNFEINAHEKCVRVFNIAENVNVTLKNLLMRGCYLTYDDYYAETLEGVVDEYTGAVIYNMGNLTIMNSTFIANKANIGGAIYNGGNLDITDSSFRNNQAIAKRVYSWEWYEDDGINFIKEDGGGAGAIYNDGYLNIKNTVFHNNIAESSTGAIYNDGILYMDGCLVFSNRASGPAAACGAIYTSNNATINNSRFLDNRASQGGVIVSNGANLVIENSDLSQNLVYYDHFSGSGGVIMGDGNMKLINSNFTANTCQGEGGVIYTSTGYGNSHADITVDGCNFNSNFGSGGAICNVASGTLNVLNSVFKGNKGGDGAAILNLYADMLINGSTFDRNIAASGATIIRNNFVSNGVVTSNGAHNVVVNSQFTNNIGDTLGALNLGGQSIIDNSSFIANTAKGYGGALYVRDAVITNTEFVNNSAKYGNAVYMDHPLKPSDRFDNGYFDENGLYNAPVQKPAPVVDNPTNPVVENQTEPAVNNQTNPVSENSTNPVVNNQTEPVVDNHADSNANNTNGTDMESKTDTNSTSHETSIPTNPNTDVEDSQNNNDVDNGDKGSEISSPEKGTADVDSLSNTNSSEIDDTLSSVGEIPNAVSSNVQSVSSSSSNPQSTPNEESSTGESNSVQSQSEASQSDSSKSYELNKTANKKIAESTPVVITIIGVIVLFALLILGYKYGKKDDL